MKSSNPAPARSTLIRGKVVQQMLGDLSRQGFSNLQRRDPTFPKPITLGSEFAFAWLESEILGWLAAQPRRELTGVDAVTRRRAVSEERRVA